MGEVVNDCGLACLEIAGAAGAAKGTQAFMALKTANVHLHFDTSEMHSARTADPPREAADKTAEVIEATMAGTEKTRKYAQLMQRIVEPTPAGMPVQDHNMKATAHAMT